MKTSILIGLCMVLVLLCGAAAADWNVTWTPVKESIIDKEYIITVQNLQDVKQDVNIASFFDETNFDISHLSDIEFHEWKLVPYTYTVDHYDEMSYLEFDSLNDTWYIREEKVYNHTEIIESEKLDWKACKSQLFTETSKTKKDNYGFINIPALGSKPKDDGTYDGTKTFMLKFKTPIVYTDSYGTSGKVAVLLDGAEYHPYWNTTWSTRKIITLTGNTSGAQTDYQLLLNISYETGMQTDFDDLRFCNETHELDAWLESKVDSSYALIWVEFPTTPANTVEQTYYMYYGKADAVNYWDIGATFIAGYDFSSFSGWTGDTANCAADQTYQGKTRCLKCNDNASSIFKIQDDVVFPDAFVMECNIAEDIDQYSAFGGGDSGDPVRCAWTFRPNGIAYYYTTLSHTDSDVNPAVGTWYKGKLVAKGGTGSVVDLYIDDVLKLNDKTLNAIPTFLALRFVGDSGQGNGYYNDLRVRKYAANPPTYAFGNESYYADSIHYNSSNSYNNTIQSDGIIIVNRSITAADDVNWTAAALTDDCNLVVTEYNLSNITIANFTLYNATLDWLKVTNLTTGWGYKLANDTVYELHVADGNGEINFTNNLIHGNYQIILGDTSVNITCYSVYPETVYTNYTGILTGSYIVESNFPLNFSSLAFLMGMNYTLTDDYHSYLKVPANSIASDGIYRAHNRNTTPYMSWENNNTITEGNVWKWGGGVNEDFWITNQSINATHTWVNVTGVMSNVLPSMMYLGRKAMYESPKTGVEINKGQGVIIKIWDLEELRGRNSDYWVRMFFDSQIETTPSNAIDIWYCNNSFDPDTDDPVNCEYCERLDTWSSSRWLDHEDYQPHNNVSYSKPLIYYAGEPLEIYPDDINYVYLTSGTQTSKSYILNATNSDPGICNLTYAQTQTMWLRDEVAGTNTPYAYTPSFFMATVRDYLEFTHHMYIANNQDTWGHSDICTIPIGISNVPPTYCRYNYFLWNGTTDYHMNGSYSENVWINLTYGLDPDNGAPLTHVLSLYDSGNNFIAVINDSLEGNATDVDIFFDVSGYDGLYQLKIVSTDNEGSTSTAWSPVFHLGARLDEEIPLNLFIVLMVLMFGSLFYIYHAETYVAKIVTSLITTWMSFMLSSMIVSGNVVLNYAELSSGDTFVYGAHLIQIASLSHFFMFTGVVSALFMLTFAVKLVIDTYLNMQEKRMAEEEWDGVEVQ